MAYNSTIITRKKQLKCGHFDFNFSGGNCRQCATIASTKKRMDKVADREEENGLPELIEILDGIISKYVRIKAIGEDNLVGCYTCNTRLPYTELDCGHFVSRSCMFLRFDVDRNLRPQCVKCNRGMYGNIPVFGKRLNEEKEGLVELLMEESNIVHKWSRHELQNMIDEYTVKLVSLKKSKQLKS